MTVYYISPSGNDTNTSLQAQSSSTPWQTVSKFETSSAAGDTCIFLPGTHVWAASTINLATAVGKTYNGIDPTLVTVAGTAGGELWNFLNATTIRNIKFTNSVPVASYSFFANNTLGNIVTFERCIFSALAVSSGAAIFGSTSFGAVIGTYVLRACLFYNTVKMIFGSGIGSGGPVEFYNNTIYSDIAAANVANLWTGAGYGGPAQPWIMKNNIVFNGNGTPHGLFDILNASTPVISGSNNLFFGWTGPGDWVSINGNGYVNSNPLFVDGPGGNFNLRPGSPCIDAGVII